MVEIAEGRLSCPPDYNSLSGPNTVDNYLRLVVFEGGWEVDSFVMGRNNLNHIQSLECLLYCSSTDIVIKVAHDYQVVALILPFF